MPKETTNDELARMIAKGFEAVTTQISDVDRATDERLLSLESEVKNGFRHVDARLATIEYDISDIRKHFVYRDEFEDLMGRVKYLVFILSFSIAASFNTNPKLY